MAAVTTTSPRLPKTARAIMKYSSWLCSCRQVRKRVNLGKEAAVPAPAPTPVPVVMPGIKNAVQPDTLWDVVKDA